ncbi:hypothetical protein D9757_015096 [Collybiopsis confluens]|uniref:Uncharacterized protein n=1 Tax=Collybiopsis confluens TaxID=2823264 RepID=A0A8H5CQK7_9AGAR|nr:hypothetical protein D9757_015096 [Collybiopsis confluens]
MVWSIELCRLNVRKQLRKNMDQAITLEPLGSMKFKAASDSQTSPSASPNDVDHLHGDNSVLSLLDSAVQQDALLSTV